MQQTGHNACKESILFIICSKKNRIMPEPCTFLESPTCAEPLINLAHMPTCGRNTESKEMAKN